MPVTLETMPLFVRAGSVIPLGDPVDRADVAHDTARTLAVFPHKGAGEATSVEYEDDGISIDAPKNDFRLSIYRLASRADEISLDWSAKGSFTPNYSEVTFVLPEGEKRALKVNGQSIGTGETLRRI